MVIISRTVQPDYRAVNADNMATAAANAHCGLSRVYIEDT